MGKQTQSRNFVIAIMAAVQVREHSLIFFKERHWTAHRHLLMSYCIAGRCITGSIIHVHGFKRDLFSIFSLNFRRVHGRFGAVLPPQDALWADTSG